MKNNYRSFIKITNWVLAGILGLLGFSSCIESGEVEYGVPSADYTVKGTVVNKSNGKPIGGIQVNIVPPYRAILMYGVPPTNYYPKQAVNPVVTNAKGEFKLSDRLSIEEVNYNLPFSVALTDIDGEKNGSFASDTLSVDFKDAVLTGKQKGWYDGEYVKTVKVELTEKKANE
jgi:putative lipoprotein (rSAM/lipoprotein system)